MCQALTISERRACALVGLARTTLRRVVVKEEPATLSLKGRITALAHERRRFGYRRIHDLRRREGVHANHKRVYRLYREAGLAVRKRRRRKLVMLDRQALHTPAGPNEIWSMDFVMTHSPRGAALNALRSLMTTPESVSTSLSTTAFQAAMWRACLKRSVSLEACHALFAPIKTWNLPAGRSTGGPMAVVST